MIELTRYGPSSAKKEGENMISVDASRKMRDVKRKRVLTESESDVTRNETVRDGLDSQRDLLHSGSSSILV